LERKKWLLDHEAKISSLKFNSVEGCAVEVSGLKLTTQPQTSNLKLQTSNFKL